MPVKSTQRGDFPQTEFTSAEDANITWGPQTGWPVWGDAAPVSMPTDNKFSSITPAPSADSSSPPPPAGRGLEGAQRSACAASARPSSAAVSSFPSTPQALRRSGSLSWARSRFSPAARERGLAARPHSLAKRPYFSAAVPSAALKWMTWGKIRALSRPWGR